jgi:lipopolysaccharide/colanic/teichoic acid biosynthesis glycosyltransferase
VAALILLQKSSFSLNDSHAFNRPDEPHTQHWQQDAVTRWNFRKKASRISLHLLRLHIAFIFVLCASVAVLVTRLSAIKSDN